MWAHATVYSALEKAVSARHRTTLISCAMRIGPSALRFERLFEEGVLRVAESWHRITDSLGHCQVKS